MLASFDPSTPCGQRDQAIVQCLATLGLRPGEVANLCLDDIDWRGGTLQIRTRKNRRGAVLPLPRVVGQALVAYLSGDDPKQVEVLANICFPACVGMNRRSLQPVFQEASRPANSGVNPPGC